MAPWRDFPPCFHAGRPASETWLIPGGGGWVVLRGNQKKKTGKPQSMNSRLCLAHREKQTPKKNRANARKTKKNTQKEQKHPRKAQKHQKNKGHANKRAWNHDENLQALATYLPPTSPSTAKSRTQRRRGGRGGSPIPRPLLFLLRTCADVRFSVQMPPKPAGDLPENFPRASARTSPARCAHDPNPPQVPQNGCFWLCRWPQNREVPKKSGNIFAGAGLPTYLP